MHALCVNVAPASYFPQELLHTHQLFLTCGCRYPPVTNKRRRPYRVGTHGQLQREGRDSLQAAITVSGQRERYSVSFTAHEAN
eukprot:18519-Eustigmatos_ZCMA.PRE.1